MIRKNFSTALFSVTIVSAVAVAAMPAQAGTLGNGAAGSGFPQYRSEADAQKQCGNDKVVWGSSAQKGVFYMPGAGPKRIGGFYACAAVATKAGMKIESGK